VDRSCADQITKVRRQNTPKSGGLRLGQKQRVNDDTGIIRRRDDCCEVIVLLTVLAGELNTVAVVVTIAFLLTYGMVNLATFYEAHANSPSFRPTLRAYNKWASLAGVVACAIAILAIEPAAGLTKGIVAAVLYSLIAHRNDTPVHWTVSIAASHFTRAADLLLRLEAREPLQHPRDWRAQILSALPTTPIAQPRLLRLTEALRGERATVTGLRFLAEKLEPQERRTIEDGIRTSARESGLGIFPLAVGGITSASAFSTIFQSQGLGHLRPNTLLMDTGAAAALSLHSMIMTAIRNNISVIAATLKGPEGVTETSTVDI
jgi:hypothetical protein